MSQNSRIEDDHALVRDIIAGSVPSWHAFVEEYTPIILSVLRRYVFDEDEQRDVWVQILERLHGGLLEQWAGRSRLSTWLFLVARTGAIDHLRHQRGRRKDPPGLAALPERERFVYRELFRRGRSIEEVRQDLLGRGKLADGESMGDILDRLEELVGDRTLQRVAWDLAASSVGVASGRLLEYMEGVAAEVAQRQEELSPERNLLHEQTRETLARIRELMESLPEEERRVLELRFGRGWSAPQIAASMGLERQRAVYTLIDRALRNLRRMMGLGLLLAWTVGICAFVR